MFLRGWKQIKGVCFLMIDSHLKKVNDKHLVFDY